MASKASRAASFHKSFRAVDDVMSQLTQQLTEGGHRFDHTHETKWQVYLLQKTDNSCFVVVVPDTDKSISFSFGIGITNDNKVMPNYKILEMDEEMRPATDNIRVIENKGETEEGDLRIIVEHYLSCLEGFGKFHRISNNCINFAKRFISILTTKGSGVNTKLMKCKAGMRCSC